MLRSARNLVSHRDALLKKSYVYHTSLKYSFSISSSLSYQQDDESQQQINSYSRTKRRQRTPKKLSNTLISHQFYIIQNASYRIHHQNTDDLFTIMNNDINYNYNQKHMYDINEKQSNKFLEIRQKMTAIGEYLYGPNAIYSALKSNKREHFHRLFMSPVHTNIIGKHPSSLSKREQRYIEISDLCRKMNIPIEICNKRELNAFVSKNMHQGFVLDCDPLVFQSLNEYPIIYETKKYAKNVSEDEHQSRIWLAFDRLQNEENIGSILRSGLFFGIDGVIYSEIDRNIAPLSTTVANASCGALDCIDIRILNRNTLHEYLLHMRDIEGFNIIGLDCLQCEWKVQNMTDDNESESERKCMTYGDMNKSESDIDSDLEEDELLESVEYQLNYASEKDAYANQRIELHEFNKSSYLQPMIIVIGNESRGLSDDIRKVCNKLIHIQGNQNAAQFNVDSLNAASALSVALYQILHNRFL